VVLIPKRSTSPRSDINAVMAERLTPNGRLEKQTARRVNELGRGAMTELIRYMPQLHR
jgi:hypothetical protein